MPTPPMLQQHKNSDNNNEYNNDNTKYSSNNVTLEFSPWEPARMICALVLKAVSPTMIPLASLRERAKTVYLPQMPD